MSPAVYREPLDVQRRQVGRKELAHLCRECRIPADQVSEHRVREQEQREDRQEPVVGDRGGEPPAPGLVIPDRGTRDMVEPAVPAPRRAEPTRHAPPETHHRLDHASHLPELP